VSTGRSLPHFTIATGLDIKTIFGRPGFGGAAASIPVGTAFPLTKNFTATPLAARNAALEKMSAWTIGG